MTYEYLTAGKTKTQRREVDQIILGPDLAPADLAKANREAMQALGAIGMVGARRTKS